MDISNLFSTIDTQVLGENFRIIIQSPITFTVTDIKKKNELLQQNFVEEKKLLLNEPRGHRGVNGCLVFPSDTDSFELLFINHENSIPFKYEGVAASLTALLETGNLSPNSNGKYSVLTPYGRIYLSAILTANQVTAISINVSAVEKKSAGDSTIICIDKHRNYKIATLPQSIGSIDINNLEALTKWGEGVIEQSITSKPELTGVLVAERLGNNRFKSITFERDGYIRRTPGIDSTEAIIASFEDEIQHEKSIKNETIFSSQLIADKKEKDKENYRFQLRPFITGSHDFLLDQDDPLPKGFLLK